MPAPVLDLRRHSRSEDFRGDRRTNLDGYQALLLHEAGHALGILADPPSSGHSGAEQDVMFPIANWTEVSPEDQRAIRALYAETPDIVREDQMPNAPEGPEAGAGPNLAWLESREAPLPPGSFATRVSCNLHP